LSADLPELILKAKKAGPFLGRHPWVFSGAIDKIEGRPADGGEILLRASDGRFVARGLYNSQSQIRARLYSWNETEALTDAFFADRVLAAVSLRKALGLLAPEAACRLVFSEGDGISGMTADYYAGFIALQFNALALAQRREAIATALTRATAARGVYVRTEKGIRELEGLDIDDGPLSGEMPEKDVTILENGLRFEVDVREGQKTGFYSDQRDNRRTVAGYALNRRCLDVCCYTGGFSLNLARAGAASVTGLDSSAAALDAARRNAARNNLSNIDFVQGDAFTALDAMGKADRTFDLLVLDPPRFVQSSGGVSQALKAYVRLNALALRLVSPGAVLATCSCSGRLSPDEFLSVLAAAALTAGRTVRVLEKRGQPADHPVNAACPESEYLKCFICHVE